MSMVHNGTMREIEDSMQDLIWDLEDLANQDKDMYIDDLAIAMRIDDELSSLFMGLREKKAHVMGHGQ